MYSKTVWKICLFIGVSLFVTLFSKSVKDVNSPVLILRPHSIYSVQQLRKNLSKLDAVGKLKRRFAVFGCSTPDRDSHRGFDYAFYLPLTALAWDRIGFESVVLIIGDRTEWQTQPILGYVLKTLEELPFVTVLFISAKLENRAMLSQTARIFVSNMKIFPGRHNDYVMTSDADLWPLRKEHYYVPRSYNCSLLLVHSQCCGHFKYGGRTYRMFPMSHIGASVETWKHIVNRNSTPDDAITILEYFKQFFGDKVLNRVKFASDNWFLDQKVISILLDNWISHQSSTYNNVYKVSDTGYQRIDRANWNPLSIHPPIFNMYYDAHLIEKGFLTENWNTIKPLLRLMYPNDMRKIDWCNQYATQFYTEFRTSKSRF